MVIVRALAGLILGIGYGLLAGALTFVLVFVTVDETGPMILDNYGWGRMVTMYTTLITGGCGAFVGLVVGLSGVNKTRGGMIGAVVGLVIITPFVLGPLSELRGLPWPLWKELLGALFFLLLFFPFGLSLTGIGVSVVAHKWKPQKTEID